VVVTFLSTLDWTLVSPNLSVSGGIEHHVMIWNLSS
jgi:hypothetical protein